MIRTALISTSLALLGTAAFSGNISEPVMVAPVAAPIATSQDWTGFYLGGQYLNGDVDVAALATSFDVDGFGVHVGYLYDLGSFVVGGELDYDSVDGEVGSTNTEANVARAKAIAGYDLGRFMPYLTVGIASVEFDPSGMDLQDSIGFYGLGGTYAVTDNFRVGAEYLMHQGDNFDGTGIDVDINTLSLRASYSF